MQTNFLLLGCRESRDEALLAEIAGNYDDEDKPLKEAYYEQFSRLEYVSQSTSYFTDLCIDINEPRNSLALRF